MKAVVYRAFCARPEVEHLADPVPRSDGVVLKVKASGVCLSDWHVPEEMDFQTSASLGCRFATSFRAIVDQGRVAAGQWVTV